MQNIKPCRYNARTTWGYQFKGLHRFSFFKFRSSSVFLKKPCFAPNLHIVVIMWLTPNLFYVKCTAQIYLHVIVLLKARKRSAEVHRMIHKWQSHSLLQCKKSVSWQTRVRTIHLISMAEKKTDADRILRKGKRQSSWNWSPHLILALQSWNPSSPLFDTHDYPTHRNGSGQSLPHL